MGEIGKRHCRLIQRLTLWFAGWGSALMRGQTMRSELQERLHELTVLRKRAGDITLRIRREADLLADVHHDLADLLSAIGPLCLAQTWPSSSSSSSRSSTTTEETSSSSANVDVGPRPALLRIGSVATHLGLSRSQVWRMVKEGRFPKPRRLSTRAVAWLEPEVSAWIDGRPVFDGPHQPARRPRRYTSPPGSPAK
jgi:prophage regulatory protein